MFASPCLGRLPVNIVNIGSPLRLILWRHWHMHSDWLETLMRFEVFWTFIEKYFFKCSRLPVCLSLPYYASLVKILRAHLPWKLIENEIKFRFFDSPTGCSSMCTLFVARVLHIWPYPCFLRWPVADRTKPRPRYRHVEVKQLSEFLTCGRFW